MKLNPEMAILAREFQGLTQSELAERSGLTQSRIARIEAGVSADLGDEEVLRLSQALGFRKEFFFLSEQRYGYGTSSVFTRSRQLTAGEKKRLSGLVNVSRIQIKRMLDHVDIGASRSLPRLSLSDYHSPAGAAAALRETWKMPQGPVKNLTKLIEGAGVVIAECDFLDIPMDATSVSLGDIPPIIFINRNVPGDRWRFTLAHELAHLVMHDVPKPDMEDEADEFAAEFLIPSAEIAPDLTRMRADKLSTYATLKSYWGVSMAALIMKAKALGKISKEQARNLFMQMSKLHIRKNEPNPIPRESTNLHPMMMNYFRNDLKFTEEEFSNVVLLNPDRLKSSYGASSEKPRLRVVQ